MLRIAILLAGLIVCLPALGVAYFLRDVPGATMAALATFGFIYTPFVGAVFAAGRLREFFLEGAH